MPVRKGLKLQWRYFLSYILLFALPMLAATIIYNMAYKLVEQKELEMRSLQMQECMSTIDQSMQKIDSALIDMMRNTNLTKLLALPQQPQDGSPDAALVHSVYQDLSTYISYANLDCDLVLYMRRPDLVFDGQSIVYGQENFYRIGNSYEGIDYATFKETVLDTFHFRDVVGDVTIEKKKRTNKESLYIRERGFLYLNTLPLASGRYNNLGTAVVHVGAKIEKALSQTPVSEFGCTYVADSEQSLISGVFGSQAAFELTPLPLVGNAGTFYQTVDGHKMLVTYVRSQYNGWHYISMSPMDHIMSGLRSFQVAILLIAGAVAISGILLSLYFSRKNARPVEEALTELQIRYGKGNRTPEDLNKALKGIITDNAALQNSLERQRLQARNAFYESLFHGEFRDDEEILAKARYLELNIEAEAYCVMLLAFDMSSTPSSSDEAYLQTDIAQIFTKKVTLRQAQLHTLSHPLSESRLGILMCFGQQDEKANMAMIKSVIGQIINSSENQLLRDPRCFVGGLCTGLSNICISFGEASTAFEMQKARPVEAPVVFYKDVITEKRGYFYPAEIETKLKLLTLGGAEDRVEQVLDYLYEENFRKLLPNRQMAYALISDMYTTVINIAGERGLEFYPQSFYKMRPNTLDSEAEFAQLRSAFRQLSHAAAGREHTEQDQIIGLEEYVHENYGNSALGIAVMAQHFHISETYFSQYFKKSTGQSFSKYLETLRINSACALLRDTSNSIDEISETVGYTSALSFRRAFKKVMGISPSTYRQSSHGEAGASV